MSTTIPLLAHGLSRATRWRLSRPAINLGDLALLAVAAFAAENARWSADFWADFRCTSMVYVGLFAWPAVLYGAFTSRVVEANGSRAASFAAASGVFLVWMVLLGYAPDPEIIRLQHFRAVNNRLIEFSDAEGTAAANAAAGALQTTSGAAGLSQGQSSSAHSIASASPARKRLN